jgi:putative phage-type endonuclease
MSATITRGIGGSDIAAIVGLSPYKTPADVYARILTGDSSKAGTRARLGNLAEPEILRDYCERHSISPAKFERNVEMARRDKPFMRGELDALLRGNHGVECKLVGFRQADRWGDDGSDHIPDEYLCQVAWYTMLADVPLMRIAAWFDGGGDYREFEYQRNADLEASLVAAAEKFWTDHIEKGVPPSLVGANADSIRVIFPAGNGKLREATPDEAALITTFAGQRETLKEAEAECDASKSALQALIGSDDGLYCPLGKVTWKNVKVSQKTDWEAVAKAMHAPATLIDAHTNQPAGYRRFLFTPKKG